MTRIAIVGAGYAGFYTAWTLERRLRAEEAEIIVIDPRPYMTYQPFLPEVTSGAIEARHSAVSLRRHLRRSRIISGSVVRIDHRNKTLFVRPFMGTESPVTYDIVVVTAGAVSRKLPVPGADERAIGLKNVEEAVAIRDRVLTSFDQAAALPPGPDRQRLLTYTFVGGGFAGIEAFGELLSLTTSLVRSYREIRPRELSFHLIEAQNRILPEVSARTAGWVFRSLQRRGGQIHLNTKLVSAVGGHMVLSDGEEFDSDLLVWTAGNAANPVISHHTDLPIDGHGLIVVRPDLRVGTSASPVADAWAAGDNAAVPDLATKSPGRTTPPNAQHAVRQGKRLARNIIASLRGDRPANYRHRNLGVVATLGLGRGVFQAGPIVIKGFPAWLMHRGYHVLAVPSWERKIRVLGTWLPALLFGRDIVSLEAVQHPRQAFVRSPTM